MTSQASFIQQSAIECEKSYEWREAAEKYVALLSEAPPGSEEAVNAAMRMGYCDEQGAYQSLSAPEFERLLEAGIEAFRTVETQVTFEASETLHMMAKARRLRLQSIMSVEHDERVLLMDDSIGVQRVVLQKLEPTTGAAYFEQANFHLQLIYGRALLHGDEHVTSLLTEGLDLIERLITTKSLPIDPNLMGDMYLKRLGLAVAAYFAMEGWSGEEGRVLKIAEETASLATKMTDHLTLARLHSALANAYSLFGGFVGTGTQEHLDLALAEAQKTDNGTEIGVALAGLTFSIRWKLVAERNEEAARQLYETIKLYFEEGRRRLGHLSDPTSRYFLLNLYGDMVQSCYVYATGFITNQLQRRKTIEEGVSIFRDAYRLGEGEFNDNLPYLWYAGAEALQQLALIEEDAGNRKAILNEAVELDRRATEVTMRTSPHFAWNVGIQMISEATVRSLLAKDIQEGIEKKGVLETAAVEFKDGFSRIGTVGTPLTDGQVLRMGNAAFRFARVLQDLYELSGERKLLEDEVKVLDDATKDFDKIGRSTRVAEALWLKARVKDRLGRPQEAAREYARASESYGGSVTESISLRALYGELSQYMLHGSKLSRRASLIQVDTLRRPPRPTGEPAISSLGFSGGHPLGCTTQPARSWRTESSPPARKSPTWLRSCSPRLRRGSRPLRRPWRNGRTHFRRGRSGQRPSDGWLSPLQGRSTRSPWPISRRPSCLTAEESGQRAPRVSSRRPSSSRSS